MKNDFKTKTQLISELSNLRCELDDIKGVEKEKRNIERRYHELIQESLDGYAMLDKHGKFLLCNPVYCKITGYRVEELKRKTYKDLTPGKYYALDQNQLELVLNRGVSDLYEKEYIRRDGSSFPIEIRSYLIRDAKGDFDGTWSYVRDITERKQAEQDLKESEKKFRSITENASDFIFIKDKSRRYTFANKAMQNLLDLPEREILGKKPNEIFGPEQGAIIKEVDDRTFSGETVNETRSLSIGDKQLYFNTIQTPLHVQDGAVTSIMGIVRDFSDQRRAEQERQKLHEQLLQAQKMESVGRLAGGVAHDFNNMLSVIIGHSELMLAKLKPEEPFHAELTQILNAASRSADITRQLLAFARKQTIAPIMLDLNETVERMLKMLRRIIGEDIDLAWLPATNAWPVKMDPTQIDQILANLCVNARDAIEGVGNITIETHNVVLDENYCAEHAGFLPGEFVMLVVSDNGCGIEKEILPNVFEPFFTTKDLGKGTGLGLSTVYGIVKQNRGFINVYSEPGRGSTIKIYFPRQMRSAAVEPQKDIGHVYEGHGESVLLVEDDASVLNVAKIILEELRYSVLPAGSPEKALEIALTYPEEIRLLITDVVMPEMSGKDLSKAVAKIRPNIRILFMSGYTADAIVHHGILEKGKHFVQKPLKLDMLARKVREVLERNK